MKKMEKKRGVITAHYGVAVDVHFYGESGSRSEESRQDTMIRVKRNSGHIVGDEVEVHGEHLIRLPRRTEIKRRDARRGLHVVGANLDTLCIVTACEPLPPPGFLDRAIVAARSAALQPLLLVNKADLPCFTEYAADIRKSFANSLPIFTLSATSGEGVLDFAQFLSDNHRGIFVGATGVGKSSILNSLIPKLSLETGEISHTKKRGRHTTTVSTLHRLPRSFGSERSGELIDSPGFNDFGLVDIASEELARFFPGFEKTLQTPCRFRNCKHRHEPDCSVLSALHSGDVSLERYKTYLILLEEIEGVEGDEQYRKYRKRRKK